MPVVSERPQFVCLRSGMVVPIEALEAVLDLERAGHRLTLDGADIMVEPARANYEIDPAMLEALKRWKPHCRMLIAYTADDRHLRPAGRSIVAAPARRHTRTDHA